MKVGDCVLRSLEEVDVSAILGQGVFLLWHRGDVVYIGHAKSMLEMISAHAHGARRSLPPWFPIRGIVFDRVEVIPGAGPSTLAALITIHAPRYNAPTATVIPIPTSLRRRV